jgi:preprotein translocase subunit YajC
MINVKFTCANSLKSKCIIIVLFFFVYFLPQKRQFKKQVLDIIGNQK